MTRFIIKGLKKIKKQISLELVKFLIYTLLGKGNCAGNSLYLYLMNNIMYLIYTKENKYDMRN
jgi:hypothetical protein